MAKNKIRGRANFPHEEAYLPFLGGWAIHKGPWNGKKKKKVTVELMKYNTTYLPYGGILSGYNGRELF